MAAKVDVMQGTLDLMILKTLDLRPMHGYGLMQRLHQLTDGLFDVTPGSFPPNSINAWRRASSTGKPRRCLRPE